MHPQHKARNTEAGMQRDFQESTRMQLRMGFHNKSPHFRDVLGADAVEAYGGEGEGDME